MPIEKADKPKDAPFEPSSPLKIEQQEKANSQDATFPPQDATYQTGLRFAITILGLCLSVFCVALDNTIIATAIPRITDEFHALNDVGWYGSAYLLTTCAFQLFFGKLYSIFNIKWTFVTALFLFELGSLVSAVAPSSPALIVGRATAGVGSAGIFSGALIIIAFSSPIEKRPVYQGMLGGMYGVASVVGPLLGGAFTDRVSWRWCFYINLPIGGLTAFIIILLVKLSSGGQATRQGFKKILWSLDPIGTVLFVPSILCLLLALQWGGTTYAWNNGRMIALFILFGVLLIAFVGDQFWMGDLVTVPPRIGKQRTIASSSLFGLCLGGAFFLLIYYLPIWFQAIKGTSALQSGIDNIPLILSNTVGIAFSGGLTTKFGPYMPYVYTCVALTSIGSGLLTTFHVNTGTGEWIGYQVLYGFGCGCAFQLPQIAAQAVLPMEDVPIGVAITLFAEILGGAVFVSVADNVLDSHLTKSIGALNISSVNPETIVNLGATQLRNYVSAQYVTQTVDAYNLALVKTFQVALFLSCLSLLGAAGMEWKSVKTTKEPEKEPS